MANIVDHGDLLHDPEALLAERERISIRNMSALIAIVEGGKDERARVAASTELNKMLSLGLLNRGGRPVVNARQTNNLRLPAGDAADAATAKLIKRLTPEEKAQLDEVNSLETLDALMDDDDED
jgi:hypothetical protein